SQRDQATDGLGLRGDAASRLSYLIKDLKKLSLPIFVHRHIEVSAAGADLSGRAVNHILASPWFPFFLAKFLFLLRSILALEIHSFIKNLFGSTPVPVDGHSLTTQLVSQFIDLGHILNSGL